MNAMNELSPEEAVKLLESKYNLKGQMDDVLECLEIRRIALEALKKQIPKKVKNRKVLRNFQNEPCAIRGDCPECGCESLLSTNTDYCICCGQKLDWRIEYNIPLRI